MKAVVRINFPAAKIRGHELRLVSSRACRRLSGLVGAISQIRFYVIHSGPATGGLVMTRRYGLRDEEWDPIKGLLRGREGHVGGTAADIACLWKRCFIDTARGYLGVIFPSGLEAGRTSTDGCADGAKVASSSLYPNTCC